MNAETDATNIVTAGVTQAGATAAIFGGMTAHDVSVVGGLLIGAIGLIGNLWHSRQMRKIAREKE